MDDIAGAHEGMTPSEQLDAARQVFARPEFELEPEAVQRMHEAGDVQLVDVREPHEWEAGRVPGARHVELERLGWNAPTIDPDRPVCFYCRLGVRAAMAAHAFRSAGYDAYTMTGGFAAWVDQARPTDPSDGVVAEH